jgi:hypothetical protein
LLVLPACNSAESYLNRGGNTNNGSELMWVYD